MKALVFTVICAIIAQYVEGSTSAGLFPNPLGQAKLGTSECDGNFLASTIPERIQELSQVINHLIQMQVHVRTCGISGQSKCQQNKEEIKQEPKEEYKQGNKQEIKEENSQSLQSIDEDIMAKAALEDESTLDSLDPELDETDYTDSRNFDVHDTRTYKVTNSDFAKPLPMPFNTEDGAKVKFSFRDDDIVIQEKEKTTPGGKIMEVRTNNILTNLFINGRATKVPRQQIPSRKINCDKVNGHYRQNIDFQRGITTIDPKVYSCVNVYVRPQQIIRLLLIDRPEGNMYEEYYHPNGRLLFQKINGAFICGSRPERPEFV